MVGSDDAKIEYLSTRDEGLFESTDGATRFILRPLSPQERERAEVKAGAYSRSELGRQLFVEQPEEEDLRVRWHHNLPEDEKKAFGEYQGYLNRCYREMVRVSLVKIEGYEGDPLDLIDQIKPDVDRVHVMGELVAHIQSLSLLPSRGKLPRALQSG